jgi:hypothetical protein
MTQLPTPIDEQRMMDTVTRINKALQNYSEKDWNYSRILLRMSDFQSISGPYVLWIEHVQTKTSQGQSDVKTISSEVAWGERHSNELGILEIISLRLNKALLETTEESTWNYQQPIIRIVSKQFLAQQGVRSALWYDVVEVLGEDFDSR